jgi:hypothetical protein
MPEMLFQALTNLNNCAINRCQFNMIQILDRGNIMSFLFFRYVFCKYINR